MTVLVDTTQHQHNNTNVVYNFTVALHKWSGIENRDFSVQKR